MNMLPPGSDPSFAAFLGYWTLAFLVLCPMAWLLPTLVNRIPDQWQRVARNSVIAVLLAVVLGSVRVAAAQVTWDVCEQCKFMDWAMWWITFCFLC